MTHYLYLALMVLYQNQSIRTFFYVTTSCHQQLELQVVGLVCRFQLTPCIRSTNSRRMPLPHRDIGDPFRRLDTTWAIGI